MLTKQDYFTNEGYLHSSALKCYLESKELYKLRHIDKHPDYQFKMTSAVLKGTIVDELLTEGHTEYAPAVLKRDDPELFEKQKENPEKVVTPAVWSDAMAIIEQLPKHPIWQLLNDGSEFQKIVEGKIGDSLMAGKIDCYVPGIGLFDLKITNESRGSTPQRWMWHCLDMKYHVPAYVYKTLLGTNLPFYHIAVWLKDGIANVRLYKLSDEMIEKGRKDTLEAIKGIMAGDFSPSLVSINDAIELPPICAETVENTEGDEDEF